MKLMNQIIFLLTATLFFSCGTNNNQAPTFDLTLVTSPSDKWEVAQIDIESLIFTFDAEPPALLGSGQRTRNWDGVSVSQDLTTPQNDNISSFQHIEMTTTGMRPDWEITLFDNDTPDSKIVNIEEIALLSIPEDLVLENGKSYNVILTIEPDIAFVEEDDQIQLNWEGISFSID